MKGQVMFQNKRILAIDDSAAIRNYLRKILASQGAIVELAGSGSEGLRLVEQHQYDLILLDLVLPDIGGIDVLREIREENETATIVILTGLGGVKTAISSVQLGADSYLEKQDIVSAEDLTEFFYTLQRAIERRAGIVAQKQLMQIRSDFYSMVTHDLRSPAGDIQIATEMLEVMLVNPSEKNEADRAELLDVIKQSAAKLLGMISDYLDFSKIEAGYLKLTPTWSDLAVMAQQAVYLAKIQAQARQQQLILDLPKEPVMAWVDVDMLHQVLDNLLSNAVKYTPNTGIITLALRREGDEALFEVRDTGQGIAATQLPALFTKYHRVPGEATRGVAGTGLGLLIVKEIVSAHSGTVTAMSEGVRGKGTVFTVRIPLGKAPDQPDFSTHPDGEEIHLVLA